MEYVEYSVVFETERYVAISKQDLIDLWTMLLIGHKGDKYEILSPDGKQICAGEMKPEDLKVIEKWEACEGGACPIDFKRRE